MVKNGKLSRKGKTIACTKCGTKGHNRRSCTGPREKQANGKGNNKERTQGVADIETTEVVVGPCQTRESQSTKEVSS